MAGIPVFTRQFHAQIRQSGPQTMPPAVSTKFNSAAARPAVVEKPRSFWKRRFLDPVLSQFTQGITPDKIALTIAIGSCMAMFPIIGATTLLCLLAGIIYRLNQPILHLINQALFPLHLAAIYFCSRWGETLFGVEHAQYGGGVRAMVHHMNHLFWNSQAEFWQAFGTLVWHAVVVWAILAPFWIVIVYFTARPLMRWLAQWKKRVHDAVE